MATKYQILAREATREQLVDYLIKVQGIPGFHPATGIEKCRAKLLELGIGEDDWINLPDDGAADREAAKLAKQPAAIEANLEGADTIAATGYEAARDLAAALGGVLIGSDGKPLRYTDFTNWPKCLVMIPRTTDYDGKYDVPVACGGRQIFVPRGRDVELAEPFVLALLDATGIEYTQDEAGGNMTPTEVQRHSLMVKRPATYTIALPSKTEARAA